MNCPKCGGKARVTTAKGRGVEYTRQNKCNECGHTFITIETILMEKRKPGQNKADCTLAPYADKTKCLSCDKCGWTDAEVKRRKKLMKENGLEPAPDGTMHLVV